MQLQEISGDVKTGSHVVSKPSKDSGMRTQKSFVIEVAVCTDYVHFSGLSQGTTIEKELNVCQQILESYEYGIKIASIYMQV